MSPTGRVSCNVFDENGNIKACRSSPMGRVSCNSKQKCTSKIRLSCGFSHTFLPFCANLCYIIPLVNGAVNTSGRFPLVIRVFRLCEPSGSINDSLLYEPIIQLFAFSAYHSHKLIEFLSLSGNQRIAHAAAAELLIKCYVHFGIKRRCQFLFLLRLYGTNSKSSILSQWLCEK